MQRTSTRVKIDDNKVRYRIIINSEPCEPHSDAYNKEYYSLLQEIANNPSIIACGHSLPDKVTIFYSESQWTLEATAILNEDGHKEF